MHTTDAGKNWDRLAISSKLPGDPYLITTLGPDKAELATTAGAVYQTIDGGENWEAKVIDTSGSAGILDLRRLNHGSY